MTKSITSKITKVDDKCVTIEAEEIRPGLEPFRTTVTIEHKGHQDEVYRAFHALTTGTAQASG